MGNSLAAILIGSLASVTLAHAADNCLSAPKGTAPKGSHWYYRIDHATKRNCWYVRAEGEKPAASQNASLTQASPQPETPLQPSVANARAEAGPADTGPSNGTAAMPAPSADAGADNAPSTIASRWLDRPSADSENLSAPTPTDSTANVNSPVRAVAETPLAAADLSPAPGFNSVQQLLLAIVGALALAGLLAGVIFRFGGAVRHDRQDIGGARRAPWDSVDMDLATPPPLASAPTPRPDAAHEPREAIIPNEIVQLLSKLSREAAA